VPSPYTLPNSGSLPGEEMSAVPSSDPVSDPGSVYLPRTTSVPETNSLRGMPDSETLRVSRAEGVPQTGSAQVREM
jgi:hypothetical protein